MCCPNTLQCRLRLCVSVRWTVWHGVVLTLDKQRVRLLVFVWAWQCCSCSIQYYDVGRNLTLMCCCPNILQWWWRLCVYVRRNRVVLTLDEQDVHTFVLGCAWISSRRYSCSIQYARGRNLTLMRCPNALQNVDDGCTFMFIESVSCWPWTTRRWVCIDVCLNWSCYYWCSILYGGVIWLWYAMFMFLECMDVLDLDEQQVRLYLCGLEFEVETVIGFDAMWGSNLTLMCCPNTLLQWRWRLYIYVCWTYGMTSCWLWTNRKYVCIDWCVLEFEVVIGVWCSMAEVVISP